MHGLFLTAKFLLLIKINLKLDTKQTQNQSVTLDDALRLTSGLLVALACFTSHVLGPVTLFLLTIPIYLVLLQLNWDFQPEDF